MNSQQLTKSLYAGCACGKQIPVTPIQAGETLDCDCGRQLTVPRLSELRQLSGLGAYEANTIDTIHRMIDDGTLPWGEFCVVSGRPTQGEVDVWIECERKWTKGPGAGRWAFIIVGIFVFPLWWLWLLVSKAWLDEPREVHGRDTLVLVPLRASPEFHDEIRSSSQRRLRAWLQEVPIYAQLLQEYPHARITCHGQAEP